MKNKRFAKLEKLKEPLLILDGNGQSIEKTILFGSSETSQTHHQFERQVTSVAKSSRRRSSSPSLRKSVVFSLTIHGLALALYIFSQSRKLDRKEKIPEVAVTLGFQLENPNAIKAPSVRSRLKTKKTEIEDAKKVDEATKIAETLPQLPKTIEVEKSESPAPEKESPLVAPVVSSSVAHQRSQKKPVKEANSSVEKKGVKIEKKELINRLEKESRKVGKVDKASQVRESKSIKDPFSTLPQAPGQLQMSSKKKDVLPFGFASGTAPSTERTRYHTQLQAHVKSKWIIPPGDQFDKNLSVDIVIRINKAGRIVGEMKLLKSSENRQFDALALTKVKDAEPFPPIPESLGEFYDITLSQLMPSVQSEER